MVGDKIYKGDVDWSEKYTDEAIWCNANNAHIEDKGSYYEVCENVPPEPTTDEKLNALDSQYEADKERLRKAYQDAMIYGNTDRMESIKADLVALDAQYDEDYAAIESEGDDDE